MIDAAGNFERDCSDGLTVTERRVLAGWDAGATLDAIAGATGMSEETVAHVVQLYDDRPGPDPRAGLRAVNAAFVAALARERARGAAPVSRRDPRGSTLTVGQIEAMLEDRCEQVFRAIFPNAAKDGHELCVGSLAGEKGQSLRMHVGVGSRRGWWKDFSAGDAKGDVLNLIRDALFAGDKGKAVAWAKSFLGLDDADPARLEQHRLEVEARSRQRAAEAARETEAARARARARWLAARPLERGDPVTRYLAGRGIDLAVLGRAPGALRFHPELQYGPTRPDGSRLALPAMVAQVAGLDGRHLATHRTWLAPDGAGGWRKAGPAEGIDGKPKKAMGSVETGHIPLWKGTHAATLRELPAGTDVYVSEGIEDGLTAAMADPSLRVICMVALSFLPSLELPAQMGRLILLKQNDAAGSAAERSLAKGVAAHRARGRRVAFVAPPRGVKDLNDLARGAA